jgi:hypothetical protein
MFHPSEGFQSRNYGHSSSSEVKTYPEVQASYRGCPLRFKAFSSGTSEPLLIVSLNRFYLYIDHFFREIAKDWQARPLYADLVKSGTKPSGMILISKPALLHAFLGAILTGSISYLL